MSDTENKQSSEGGEGTKAGKEVADRDKVTPAEAQNVKRSLACLGKQEFGLPSYKRVEGDETNLDPLHDQVCVRRADLFRSVDPEKEDTVKKGYCKKS